MYLGHHVVHIIRDESLKKTTHYFEYKNQARNRLQQIQLKTLIIQNCDKFRLTDHFRK